MDEQKDWSEQILDAVSGPGPVIVAIVFMLLGGAYVMAHVIAAAVA